MSDTVEPSRRRRRRAPKMKRKPGARPEVTNQRIRHLNSLEELRQAVREVSQTRSVRSKGAQALHVAALAALADELELREDYLSAAGAYQVAARRAAVRGMAANYYCSAGRALFRAGHFDAAACRFRSIILRFPAELAAATAAEYLARILHSRGREAAAAKALEQRVRVLQVVSKTRSRSLVGVGAALDLAEFFFRARAATDARRMLARARSILRRVTPGTIGYEASARRLHRMSAGMQTEVDDEIPPPRHGTGKGGRSTFHPAS